MFFNMEIRWLCNTFCILITLLLSINVENVIMTNNNNNNNNNQNINKIQTNNHHSNNILEIDQNNEFIDQLSNQPHSRKKRLIWITDDGRLALPPGTSLSITPSISLPLVRHPPDGFLANLSISFPVTIDFDTLGLTDNQNPLGDIPPLFARSFGRAAGRMLGNYVSNYINYRTKRDILSQNSPKFDHKNFNINFNKIDAENLVVPPVLPDKFKHIFHGGERALLYGIVEDLLTTFGINGKACLLRTICEIHSRSIHNFGFVGEAAKLFLTATKSPFAEHIDEYVKAQRIGEGKQVPGECFPYFKECPKSIFKSAATQQNHKYNNNENINDLHTTDDNNNNEEISNSINDTIDPIQDILAM